MNNLLSYFGLVDTKIRASDKDLPVLQCFYFFPCLTWVVQVGGVKVYMVSAGISKPSKTIWTFVNPLFNGALSFFDP